MRVSFKYFSIDLALFFLLRKTLKYYLNAPYSRQHILSLYPVMQYNRLPFSQDLFYLDYWFFFFVFPSHNFVLIFFTFQAEVCVPNSGAYSIDLKWKRRKLVTDFERRLRPRTGCVVDINDVSKRLQCTSPLTSISVSERQKESWYKTTVSD